MVTEVFILRMEGRGEWGVGVGGVCCLEAQDVDKFIPPPPSPCFEWSPLAK